MSQRTLPARDRALLDRIRDTVRAVEPGAEIILYGSRARGDAGPESDWDLLVLLDGPVDRRREGAVRDRLFDLGLETATVLSVMVHSQDEWSSPRRRAMPFYANVMYDGIVLQREPTPATSNAVPGDADTGARLWTAEDARMSQERENLIRRRMERARGTMVDAERLAELGSWHSCVNRLYRACFYAVSALLLRHGFSSSKHSGVQSLFNQHFARTGLVSPELRRFYNILFANRLLGDCADEVEFAAETVRPWLDQGRQFLARVEELLSAPAPAAPGL
jgi:uncharacterized protein (UPF0332 family)/predicted nucleotidyltransferase